MKPLRTLVVDDESVARRVLIEELVEMDGLEMDGEAECGEAALRCIEERMPDVVLLDIQMPGMDGFEVVRRITGPLPAIVFVTAYSEHAFRAFEVGAVDYLLKPVSGERLALAMERAIDARKRPRRSAERVAHVLNAEAASTGRRRPKIVARRGQNFYLLDLEEVYAFRADREIVWILTERGQMMATLTLRALEERLAGTQFHRVHRSVVVNTDKIRKMGRLSSQRWLLTLSNGLEFIASKRRAPFLRQLVRSP